MGVRPLGSLSATSICMEVARASNLRFGMRAQVRKVAVAAPTSFFKAVVSAGSISNQSKMLSIEAKSAISSAVGSMAETDLRKGSRRR